VQLASVGERDRWVGTVGEELFFTIELIGPAPQFPAVGLDNKIEAIPIAKAIVLLRRLRVLDCLVRKFF